MRYDVEVQGRVRHVQVTRVAARYIVEVDGRRWSVDALRSDAQTLSLLVVDGDGVNESAGGRSEDLVFATHPGGTMTVRIGGIPIEVAPHGRRRQAPGAAGSSASGPQRITAPMPGKVVRVLVKPGDAVAARQPVVVVEAMKMENELRAARDGRVSEVAVRDGQLVEAGMLLAVIAVS